MLAKHRVKLMSMQNNKWTDRGLGTLTLRRSTGDDAASKRPYFVYTTDSGEAGRRAGRRAGQKAGFEFPACAAAGVMRCGSTPCGLASRRCPCLCWHWAPTHPCMPATLSPLRSSADQRAAGAKPEAHHQPQDPRQHCHAPLLYCGRRGGPRHARVQVRRVELLILQAAHGA